MGQVGYLQRSYRDARSTDHTGMHGQQIIPGCTVNRTYRDARSTEHTGMHGQQNIPGCTVNRSYRDARSTEHTGMHGQQNITLLITYVLRSCAQILLGEGYGWVRGVFTKSPAQFTIKFHEEAEETTHNNVKI